MSSQALAVTPSARPVVLLVDDDADTLDMYEVGLSRHGFRPLTTRDITSAALQVEALNPQAVVTDLRFEDGSGWVVIELLKENPHARHIPVVVLTGSSGPRVAGRARQLGCAAVLTKPCLPDTLADVLRKVLHS